MDDIARQRIAESFAAQSMMTTLGAQITLIDPRRNHLYQPGLTLVATGLKPADYVVSDTAAWLPDGVTWLPERVAAVDPEVKTVSTESGAWSW